MEFPTFYKLGVDEWFSFLCNIYSIFCQQPVKVSKGANVRNQYNQVPHLTQDTTWESNKNTINITNKSLEVTPFQQVTTRQQWTDEIAHKNTNDPQKKYRLGTVSESILLEGLNRFHSKDPDQALC